MIKLKDILTEAPNEKPISDRQLKDLNSEPDINLWHIQKLIAAGLIPEDKILDALKAVNPKTGAVLDKLQKDDPAINEPLQALASGEEEEEEMSIWDRIKQSSIAGFKKGQTDWGKMFGKRNVNR
jgi:hypothetical protein